jgi:hypothetical protein
MSQTYKKTAKLPQRQQHSRRLSHNGRLVTHTFPQTRLEQAHSYCQGVLVFHREMSQTYGHPCRSRKFREHGHFTVCLRGGKEKFPCSLGSTMNGQVSNATRSQDAHAHLFPYKQWSWQYWTHDQRPGMAFQCILTLCPPRDLCKSVEARCTSMRDYQVWRNRTRSPASGQRLGTSCSGVRCPNKRMLGGQVFCSYRAAHHRSCREEERQSSTPQNDRRAAQPPTYDDTPKIRPRNDRPRPRTRLCGTHVADGE